MDKLLNHISAEVNLTKSELQTVSEYFYVKKVSKKEYVLFEGDVSQHMRFINRGCIRAFTIDERGIEHIIHFGIENWWINDLYSYLTGKPADVFLQALEPTEIFMIEKLKLEELFIRVPAMERFFRLKMQNAYVALQERIFQNMSLSAENRYSKFLLKYPQIEQRVPQYMIASYLGLTPEHLSAIRKKI